MRKRFVIWVSDRSQKMVRQLIAGRYGDWRAEEVVSVMAELGVEAELEKRLEWMKLDGIDVEAEDGDES